MRGLLPWLAILHTASCGHFLFWLPMSSKSVKIALVDMGYALAKKGHQITIVCPDKAKKQVSEKAVSLGFTGIGDTKALRFTRQLLEFSFSDSWSDGDKQ